MVRDHNDAKGAVQSTDGRSTLVRSARGFGRLLVSEEVEEVGACWIATIAALAGRSETNSRDGFDLNGHSLDSTPVASFGRATGVGLVVRNSQGIGLAGSYS